MPNLILLILDDIDKLPAVLAAWRKAGVPGATILQSAGAYRTTTWLSRVGLGALGRLFEADEIRRRTLLAVIDDDQVLERAIGEAERAVGGFDRPNSGLLVVLPVAQVLGLRKVEPMPMPETLPPAVRPGWAVQRDTLVADVVPILSLEPTIVRDDSTIDQVAQAMPAHPNVHVVSVVNRDGRLVGLLSLRALADDLFFRIMPEEFLSESFDLEHVLDYAGKTRVRTAADAMVEPAWVKMTDKVKDAFKAMHERDLPGLPVVDDAYRVVGYINLLELLALCTAKEAGGQEQTA